jgi:hypothetical protein
VNVREHVLLGGWVAVALSPALGVAESAVFWASTVLIDVDHHWDYVYRNGFTDWSLRRALAFHRVLFGTFQRPEFLALNLFHTVEWFALALAAGAWLGSSAVLAAVLGMLFHLTLDLAWLAWHRATFKRALSVVEYVIRRRGLVRRGLDVDAVYREALAASAPPPRSLLRLADRELDRRAPPA